MYSGRTQEDGAIPVADLVQTRSVLVRQLAMFCMRTGAMVRRCLSTARMLERRQCSDVRNVS